MTEAGAELRFSVDTVRFDTVFTEVGSATRSFKIYNDFDRPVEIDRVAVSDRLGGRFRINVDGRTGPEVRDVFVPADDSVYVFVEVTVDPNASVLASPFVFEGAVEVTATDAAQRVVLEAYGQNAIYLPADRGRGQLGQFPCLEGVERLDDPRPYVLYGSLFVADCRLELPAGTRLYVHGGAFKPSPTAPQDSAFTDGVLLFGPGGRLSVEGTAEEPVLIASDRLEEEFLDERGQYYGMLLSAGSGPHAVRHAEIRNGLFGVIVDSAVQLTLDNTEISHQSVYGVYGVQADVTARNLAVHNTGSEALLGVWGGSYDLSYATLVNVGARDAPAITLSNFAELPDSTVVTAPLRAELRNTIAYGSQRQGIGLADVSEAEGFDEVFAFRARNSVFRSDLEGERPEALTEGCTDCLFVSPDSALFYAAARDTFTLDSMSVARGFAAPIEGILTDLPGELRDPTSPDAGAYEYQDLEE